jgi:hypothetical protein
VCSETNIVGLCRKVLTDPTIYMRILYMPCRTVQYRRCIHDHVHRTASHGAVSGCISSSNNYPPTYLLLLREPPPTEYQKYSYWAGTLLGFCCFQYSFFVNHNLVLPVPVSEVAAHYWYVPSMELTGAPCRGTSYGMVSGILK